MPSYTEGRTARINGEPITANPYPPGTLMHGYWREGWNDGDQILRDLAAYR